MPSLAQLRCIFRLWQRTHFATRSGIELIGFVVSFLSVQGVALSLIEISQCQIISERFRLKLGQSGEHGLGLLGLALCFVESS